MEEIKMADEKRMDEADVITLEFDATAGTEYKVVSEISVTKSGTVEEITNTTFSN